MKNPTSPLKGPILFLLTLLCTAVASVQIVHAATITVNSTADPTESGKITLRDALAAVNDGDTINFDAAVTGPIMLSTGELLVNDSITISGPGSASLAVWGNATSRVFHIASGKTVTISDLTVGNGQYGPFPLAANAGGGIYNDHAILAVSNCTITGNWATYGGGIYNDGESGSATLTVTNSDVSSNHARFGGGGIYNNGKSGSATLTVTNSILNVNEGTGSGGGIYNDGTLGGSAPLTVTNSFVTFNNANSNLSSGGGIYNDQATMTLNNCTVWGNSTIVNGGGIVNGNGTLTVNNSTVRDNTSVGSGGGIHNLGALSVINSTLSNNVVFGSSGSGSAIFNLGTLTILNSTVKSSQNPPFHEGTILNGGVLNIGSTILQTNNPNFTRNTNLESSYLTVTSLGYNLSNDMAGVPDDGYPDYYTTEPSGFLNRIGDIRNTDPLLGPLQLNGGPTFTHALMTGSPAINAGNPNFNPPPDYDQRGPGYLRVVNNRIDIGAFEVQPAYAAQVQQPIDVDGTSVFNVKRGVVPARFTLTQDGAATCALPAATIAVYRTGTGGNEQIDESVYTGSADTGSDFRIDSCQYVYNLSPKALGVGTYQVDIMINTQVVGSAVFQLK